MEKWWDMDTVQNNKDGVVLGHDDGNTGHEDCDNGIDYDYGIDYDCGGIGYDDGDDWIETRNDGGYDCGCDDGTTHLTWNCFGCGWDWGYNDSLDWDFC